MNKILHIFFGDSVGGTFKQTGLTGEVLIWHEIYTEGPISSNIYSVPEFKLRTEYMDKHGIPADLYKKSIEHQESVLNSFGQYNEIIIWSEHDLFDQTILIYLLNWFFNKNLKESQLKMITLNTFPGIENFKGLGQLNKEQLASLWGTQKSITREQISTGKNAWKAYCSSNPQNIEAFIAKKNITLPYLNQSLQYHLTKFPSTKNGLNEIENYILKQIDTKPNRSPAVYCGEFLYDSISPDMGDWQYFNYLAYLNQAEHPLLDAFGDLLSYTKLGKNPFDHSCKLSITSIGKSILNNKADAIEVNGIDKWLGGVHLQGKSKIWHFDNRQKILKYY